MGQIPWSISTTVRNPERVRNFLKVLKTLEGQTWDYACQEQFQILLLQNRLYGAYNNQFYSGLPQKYIDLLESDKPISFEQAQEILNSKNYVGGNDMRGRQSYNPLKKMGFVYENHKVLRFTDFGNYFLNDNYDLGEIFFKSFIKWQLPNPASQDFKVGYNIKPFIGTLHLINEVNKLCRKQGVKDKGISKLEFQLFAVTLFDYRQISSQAKKLLDFRNAYSKSIDKDTFIDNYINSNLAHIDGINNLQDYADNAIRYFRLTRYICIRGGYYIDLEPRRQVEIEGLLKFDNASAHQFNNINKYYEYLGDINAPSLPWENLTENRKIATRILEEIADYKKQLNETEELVGKKNLITLNYSQLKDYISYLRTARQDLQRKIEHNRTQSLQEAENCRNELKNIYSSRNKKSIELERLCTLALNALDDAIEIKPNYPVGDDNEPIFTAPGNKPDIECYYKDFNAICEVTMLTDRQQWFNEGQPVMRHLYDFEITNSGKTGYCLFIAPTMHRDTMNVYWGYRKIGYEGAKQRIVPLTINQFVELLEVLIAKKTKGQKLRCDEMRQLYDLVVDSADNCQDAPTWVKSIETILSDWKTKMLS